MDVKAYREWKEKTKKELQKKAEAKNKDEKKIEEVKK